MIGDILNTLQDHLGPIFSICIYSVIFNERETVIDNFDFIEEILLFF